MPSSYEAIQYKIKVFLSTVQNDTVQNNNKGVIVGGGGGGGIS